MSCFPKNKRVEDAIDLKIFNKVCFQAKFAARKSTKLPSNLNIPKRDVFDVEAPRYLQPNRAALKRNDEMRQERETTDKKRSEETEQAHMREQNALAKQKQIEAEKNFQSRLTHNLEKYERASADLTEEERASEKALKTAGGGVNVAFSPIKIRNHLKKDEDKHSLPPSPVKATATAAAAAATMERFSPIKQRREVEASRADRWQDRQVLATKVVESMPPVPLSTDTAPERLAPEARQARYGGGESFSYSGHGATLTKLEAKRCYRVLTYADNKDGMRTVMSIAEGNVYFCRTGEQKRRITPDAVAFDSKQGALSERFPINQVGVAASGNGTLPHILVAFDCWGRCSRRGGGGEAAKYEYVKFVKIEEFLNAPRTVSKKQCERPKEPHYYPKRDDTDEQLLHTRKPIDRSVFIDKRFDTKPWVKVKGAAEVSPRTKDLLSSVNVKFKAPIPPSPSPSSLASVAAGGKNDQLPPRRDNKK